MKIQYQGNQQDIEYNTLLLLQQSKSGKTLVNVLLFIYVCLPLCIGELIWIFDHTYAVALCAVIYASCLIRIRGAPRKAILSSLKMPSDSEAQMVDPTLPGARPITLCLNEEGLSRDTTISHSLWRWRMFDAAQERPEGIVFYTAADTPHLFIPRRAFTSAGECEQFLNLSNEKIKQARAELREASRVLPPPLPTQSVR